MNATVNVLCYKSKTLSNGEHPLMIRVCKDGKKKFGSRGSWVRIPLPRQKLISY